MSDSVELGKIKKTDRDVTVKDLIKIIEDAGGGGCPLCNNTSFDFVIDGNREGSYLMPFVAKDLYKSEDTTGMGAYFRIICNNCTHEQTFNVSKILKKLNAENDK
ncbi:hypothetical protein PQM29_001060 [Morganella morganii]|nr:hypothetical protein [Morganella morganii]